MAVKTARVHEYSRDRVRNIIMSQQSLPSRYCQQAWHTFSLILRSNVIRPHSLEIRVSLSGFSYDRKLRTTAVITTTSLNNNYYVERRRTIVLARVVNSINGLSHTIVIVFKLYNIDNRYYTVLYLTGASIRLTKDYNIMFHIMSVDTRVT